MREGLHKIVSDDETIVAISTPLGHSGIGVVRMSGPHSQSVAHRFFRPYSPTAGLPPRTTLVGVWNDARGERVDEVILTFFQAPRSYTGEDVLEISAHGSPLVLRQIVETARLAGARLAGPGEFTLRAVAHGKMDLIQAEAVSEFIEAQTEQQAKTALRQLDGALSKRIRPVKDKLLDVIAHLEAGIDFGDDDVDVPTNRLVVEGIGGVRVQLECLNETFGYGRMLAKGLRLIILGKPNVGKSSLFNRLVAAERAIVANTPGTTRDVVSETVSLDGVPLCFADTAGIRETSDEVEALGVTRTFEALSQADLALIVLDGSSMLDSDDRQAIGRSEAIPRLVVINKTDLPQKIDVDLLNGMPRVSISTKTGQGLEELRAALQAFLLSRKTFAADDLILTNARHHEALAKAIETLLNAELALSRHVPHEMVMLDLYGALSALDELTGEVVTEDILDRIFSTFCIGK